MSNKIKVAAIAVATLDGNLTCNYIRAIRLGEISLEKRPDIILFPEAFASGYCSADLSQYAENTDSNYLKQFRRLSKKGSCMVVVGFLEKADHGLKNAAAIFDRGDLLGVHYKSSLWPDKDRPYRDEPSLMLPGSGIDVYCTRFGRMAVMICYENSLVKNWMLIHGEADFVLSPYNCEHDPVNQNIEGAKATGIPSVWADRTGTVWKGDGYMPNWGTAGIVDRKGQVVLTTAPGVEDIASGELEI